METAQILSSSLAQGHIAVIDQELARVLQCTTSQASHSPASNHTTIQESLPWANKNPEAAASFQNEFPTLHKQAKVAAINTDNSKKGKNNRKVESPSMATWLAHSVGRNVRDGEGFNQDFPTLPNAPVRASKSKSSAKGSVWNKTEENTASPVPKKTPSPHNDFPDLQAYKKQRQGNMKPTSSFGKFEVLKKESKKNRLEVDLNVKLLGSKSSLSLAEMSQLVGKEQLKNGVEEEGAINFEVREVSKDGKWKKKGDEHEDENGFKVKNDKSKKGKNKLISKKYNLETKQEISNEMPINGHSTDTADDDISSENAKALTLDKQFKEEEIKLSKKKQEIEDQRHKLEQERAEIKQLQEKESDERLLTKDKQSSKADDFTAPPGFEAKVRPPPGFSKLASSPTDVPNDVSDLPSLLTIPPGFKKL